MTANARTVATQGVITIVVRPLPEGVWLATSEDVPGLVVEADTREQAMDLARVLALDLLELDGQLVDRKRQAFTFVFQER